MAAFAVAEEAVVFLEFVGAGLGGEGGVEVGEVDFLAGLDGFLDS